MKFVKKPIVIEAFPASTALKFAEKNWKGLPDWLVAAYEKGDVIFEADCVVISTLEGRMIASCDDWIIKGIKGELYPCKPEIFEATYETVK